MKGKYVWYLFIIIVFATSVHQLGIMKTLFYALISLAVHAMTSKEI